MPLRSGPGRRSSRIREAKQVHTRYTLVTGILSVLLLLLPGVSYYLFIIALLAWIEAAAVRLRHTY